MKLVLEDRIRKVAREEEAMEAALAGKVWRLVQVGGPDPRTEGPSLSYRASSRTRLTATPRSLALNGL